MSIFIYTFKSLYFGYLIGNSSTYFIDVVVAVERIKQSLKLERLQNSLVKISVNPNDILENGSQIMNLDYKNYNLFLKHLV